jgi:hypothetical protein
MPNRSWDEVRSGLSLNADRMRIFERLKAIEPQLDALRTRRGVSEEAVSKALDVSGEENDDLYLISLARYVEALGGRLEVQAVFDDETVTLRELPGEAAQPD